MVGRFNFILFFICILFCISVFAELTPDDKIYLDNQFQKSEARTSSKIDTQVNRIESNMKKSIEQAKTDIRDELAGELKADLKAVVVGIAGMIVVTLGIYKIIDLKLNSTRNIKKYEEQLKKDKEELIKLIEENKKFRNELINYRNMLMQKSTLQPELQPNINPADAIPIPIPNAKKSWFSKKKFLLFVFILIVFIMVIGIGIFSYGQQIIDTFFNSTG